MEHRVATAGEPTGEGDDDRPELVAWVEAARAGDHEAFRHVYDRLTPALTGVARGFRLGEADVVDVVQATWVRFWVSQDRLRDPGALPGWLVTTCRREALSVLQRSARAVPVDSDTVTALADAERSATGARSDPSDLVCALEGLRSLAAAVDRLPEHQRRVVKALQQSGESSYKSVSRTLSIPVGSIGPTRQRAIRALRQDLTLAG